MLSNRIQQPQFAGKLSIQLTTDREKEPDKLTFNDFCILLGVTNRRYNKPVSLYENIVPGKEATLDYRDNEAAGHYARGWLDSAGIKFDELA